MAADQRELHDLVVARVRDIEVVIEVDGQTAGVGQRGGEAAERQGRSGGLVRGHPNDRSGTRVGNVQVPGPVHGQAGGCYQGHPGRRYGLQRAARQQEVHRVVARRGDKEGAHAVDGERGLVGSGDGAQDRRRPAGRDLQQAAVQDVIDV